MKRRVLFKANVKGYTRTINGKSVTVRPHTDSRQIDLFRKPTPPMGKLTEDQARNPEKYTPDLFSGRSRSDEEETYERIASTDDLSKVAVGDLKEAETFASRCMEEQMERARSKKNVDPQTYKNLHYERDRVRAELARRGAA